MKISKIFHWLYFTVMMLPCVIIPIFAIYTRNENYNSNIEVEVPQNQRVDFNQLVKNERNEDYTTNGITFIGNNTSTLTFNGTSTSASYVYISFTNAITFQTNHKYLYRSERIAESFSGYLNLYLNLPYVSLGGGTNTGTIFTFNRNSDFNQKLWLSFNNTTNATNVSITYQLFDLTQMFGVGNEPTLEQFNNIFPQGYYDYTLSEIMYIPTTPISYNDTDVGSQFVYTLYNATDKYFNFDNFFGLDNVYSWIQLNWFSGNAPLGFAIFWHFFTYWLLASLAWLLFDLMVYVPLYIHRWLDKGAIE